jgi:hypothetical protein
MKTKILVSMLMMMAFVNAFSQEKVEDRKAEYEKRCTEMKAQKVAFITEKVALTPEEAQQFWALYNEKEEKINQVHKDLWQVRKDKKSGDTDYAKMNDSRIDAGVKEAQIEKEYYDKFKQILSDEKIYNLYLAEKDFQKQLLAKIRQNKPPRK